MDIGSNAAGLKKVDVRFIRYKGAIYLRKEDVVEYLLELAATEDNDVRERIEWGVREINNGGR